MTSRFSARSRATVILAMFVSLAAFCTPMFASAQTTGDASLRTEITIPTSGVEQAAGQAAGTVRDLGQYIGNMYNFLISIVGLVAAVMMIIGGFQYLTAGGDKGRVDAGKKRITNALIGLVLAFSSYAILNTINPALLTLKLPGLKYVNTTLSYISFCDLMQKDLNTTEAPTLAPQNGNPNGCNTCGCLGYFKRTRKDNNGNDVTSRLWCIMRERESNAPGYISGGCGEVTYQGRAASDINETHPMRIPEVCVPAVNLSQAELDAQFEKNHVISKKTVDVAWCANCTVLDSSNAQRLGYANPAGICSTWMNLANNNNPQDGRFNLSTKSDTNFALDTSDANHAKYMYYCGWSSNYDMCVLVAINCPATHTCGGYDSENIKFCPDGPGVANASCTDDDLNSWTGGSFGKHLGPICAANPCNAAGSCNTGVIARIGAAIGNDGISVAVRGATFGLIDSNSCE